jgi:hypothetical protein
VSRFLAPAVVFVILVGCGGAVEQPARDVQTVAGPSAIPRYLQARIADGRRPVWMRFASGRDAAPAWYTYVSQSNYHWVNLYAGDDKNDAAPLCGDAVWIGQGVTVDPSGTLYATAWFTVPKEGVITYPPHCGAAGTIYYDDRDPEDPAVDGTTLYIGNLASTVGVYANSSTRPTGELTDPSVSFGIGTAIDSHHNFFWSFVNNTNGGGQVLEFPQGHMPGIALPGANIGTDYPGGIGFDRADNLLFVDQDADAVYVYAPPYTAAATSTIRLKGTAVYCALNPAQTRLECMDYEYGAVDVYAYPAGRYLFSFNNTIGTGAQPIGIATSQY